MTRISLGDTLSFPGYTRRVGTLCFPRSRSILYTFPLCVGRSRSRGILVRVDVRRGMFLGDVLGGTGLLFKGGESWTCAVVSGNGGGTSLVVLVHLSMGRIWVAIVLLVDSLAVVVTTILGCG